MYKSIYLVTVARCGTHWVKNILLKGSVGDWKNYLTKEMNHDFCKKHSNLMEIGNYKE